MGVHYGIFLIIINYFLIYFGSAAKMNCNRIQSSLNSWSSERRNYNFQHGPFFDKNMRICYDGSKNYRTESCCSSEVERNYMLDGNKRIREQISTRYFKKILKSKSAALKKDEQIFQLGVINYIIHTIAARFKISTSSLQRIVNGFVFNVLSNTPNPNETVVVDKFIVDLSPLIYYHTLKSGAKRSLEKRQQACIASYYTEHLKTSNRNSVDPKSFNSLKKAKSTNMRLMKSIELLLSVLSTLEEIKFPTKCLEAMTRNHLCPICFGLANISSVCSKTCLNVYRGCHIHWANLSSPWKRYLDAMGGLIHQMAAKWDISVALKKVTDLVVKHLSEVVVRQLRSMDQMFQSKCFVVGKGIQSASARVASSMPTPKFPKYIGKNLLDFRELLRLKLHLFQKLVQKPCLRLPDVNCWNGTHLSSTGYSKPVPEFVFFQQRGNPEISTQSQDQENIVSRLQRTLDGHRAKIIIELRGKQNKISIPTRQQKKVEGSGILPEGSGDSTSNGKPPDEEQETGSGASDRDEELSEKEVKINKLTSQPRKRDEPLKTVPVTVVTYDRRQPKGDRHVSSAKSVTPTGSATLTSSPSVLLCFFMLLPMISAAWG